MTVVPVIWCDFLAGVYYNIDTGYCSLADLFNSATVDGGGLLPNFPSPWGPFLTDFAVGVLTERTLIDGGTMVATWTDTGPPGGPMAGEPEGAVFLLDSIESEGLRYLGPVPPSFPATTNFYAAAVTGDYQGTAVCSWDPSIPQQYISFNGGSVIPGDGVQTVFLQNPGLINSTYGGPPELFRLKFLAFYGRPDIPQSDFPPISGGSPPPGPPPPPVPGVNAVRISQAALLTAYGPAPGLTLNTAWTFVMDGHRFYVLPLGPEGDWAYDTTTQEWSQLSTQGFPGLNFTHGVMWGLRVMGGDALYNYLYELDPTQANDEAWREIVRMVTGGIATRSRAAIGVANFTLTASVGDDASISQPISLAFSDDNGVSWSQEFDLPLTDMGTQSLLWPALGSFSAPGRVFRITDTAGPVRIDGADAVLTIGTGVDASQDQDKQA